LTTALEQALRSPPPSNSPQRGEDSIASPPVGLIFTHK
jgi:hypothetical protein